MRSGKRILITGGAGFVGAHLAGACLDAGDEVHVIVREAARPDRLAHLAPNAVPHRFDLRCEAELRRCIQDSAPDVIYHLAASPRRAGDAAFTDARSYFGEDMQILIALLNIAARSRRPPAAIVRTGSLAEYGLAPRPYREDMREEPVTLHGACMAAATHLIAALQPRLPYPVTTARLALIYGPTQSTDYFVPWLVRRSLAGETSLVRRPDDRRDLIHVDDAVAALMKMARLPLPGAALVNIASGIAPSMRELAGHILAATGADPALVLYGADGPLNGAPDLCGCPDRAARLLGWKARVPLAEGLRRLIAWHREHDGHLAMAGPQMTETRAMGAA